MFARPLFIFCAALAFFTPAAVQASADPSPTASPSAGPSASPAPGPALPGASGAPQPYAPFVKNAERQSGLIDILSKDDEVYLDLAPEQFDKPFIVAPVLASGAGTETFAGRVYRSFLLEFKRVGKRVLWIEKNADFSAPPQTFRFRPPTRAPAPR